MYYALCSMLINAQPFFIYIFFLLFFFFLFFFFILNQIERACLLTVGALRVSFLVHFQQMQLRDTFQSYTIEIQTYIVGDFKWGFFLSFVVVFIFLKRLTTEPH